MQLTTIAKEKAELFTHLLGVNCPPTNSNFDQIAGFDLDFKEVAATGRHRLVADDGFEGVSIADSHSYGSCILIYEFFLIHLIF